ncbi:hypothetical protein BOTBODRAFT_36290 [Botryobasidium botryosum FD-172 SS1]|uniref:COP9 signalosome complex subunit 3 n=1 Tax=Botryobasidium botryosum (strain FD-172 SS1) TaxID=930990 RepID=A0A067M6T2_BOTB1|nr:hypothetical protein BOTBODRAFT_36290 [Botryobasidium botryosum FD-172 SS1]
MNTHGLLSELLKPKEKASEHLDVLRSVLKQREGGEAVLSGGLEGGEDPLEILNPAINTLGVLFMMSSRLQNQSSPPVRPQLIANFCNVFEPEAARLAPERVTLLARGILRSSVSAKAAIPLLLTLLTRYAPNLSYLTTIHPVFLEACVSSSHFTHALPVLRVPITKIDKSLSDLHYNDNLQYHYYGGVVFAALKKYKEAEEFFEIVVSSPAQVPAALQLEAYKKLVLIQLISHGKLQPVPKYTHALISRALKNNSPYVILTKAYPAPQEVLTALLEKEIQAFAADGNTGLATQAIQRSPRWILKKLTETYLTLSLSEISQVIGISSEAEVRALVLSMIEMREIHASLSPTGTLTFLDDPSANAESVDKLLRDAQELGRSLAELDRELGIGREFLSKALKDGGQSENAGIAFMSEDADIWGSGMPGPHSSAAPNW